HRRGRRGPADDVARRPGEGRQGGLVGGLSDRGGGDGRARGPSAHPLSAGRTGSVRPVKLPEAPQASSPLWWFWERFTDVHTGVYKLSHGRIGGTYQGVPVALVESVGRKSGKRRTHPRLCTEDGENLVLIASKGGVHKHPAWYLNLKAHPDTVAYWKGRRR